MNIYKSVLEELDQGIKIIPTRLNNKLNASQQKLYDKYDKLSTDELESKHDEIFIRLKEDRDDMSDSTRNRLWRELSFISDLIDNRSMDDKVSNSTNKVSKSAVLDLIDDEDSLANNGGLSSRAIKDIEDQMTNMSETELLSLAKDLRKRIPSNPKKRHYPAVGIFTNDLANLFNTSLNILSKKYNKLVDEDSKGIYTKEYL